MVWQARTPVLEVFHLLDPDAEPRRVFRIVKTAPPTLDDFTSAYVLGRPKARGIQLASTAVHMALSVMQTLDQAISRAAQFPQIGGYVAELALRGGEGFAIASTVEPGHLSLWGAAVKLDEAIVDVYAVEQS